MEPFKEGAVYVNGNRLRHIQFKLTVNQRAILIEELVNQRKQQCVGMVEGMVSELKKNGAHFSVVKFMKEHRQVIAGERLTAEWFNVDTAFRFVLNTTLNLKEVLENLDGNLDATTYGNRVDAILSEPDASKRAQLYTSLLNDIHQAYIHIPLYGKRMPSVINKRLMGYTPGNQQFDYPVHKLRVVTGSDMVTVSPGSSGGLFDSVGRLDPHSYRPNEFWANNWVYEGLVKFGVNGVEPALASSWSISK